MSYFALSEYEELSQKLFEKTFKNSLQIDHKVDTSRLHIKLRDILEIIENMDENFKQKIFELNSLDFELYKFAKQLFFERLKFYKISFKNT